MSVPAGALALVLGCDAPGGPVGPFRTTCPRCEGTGEEDCYICDGSGLAPDTSIFDYYESLTDSDLPRVVSCGTCFGDGKVPCTLCGADGVLGNEW